MNTRPCWCYMRVFDLYKVCDVEYTVDKGVCLEKLHLVPWHGYGES